VFLVILRVMSVWAIGLAACFFSSHVFGASAGSVLIMNRYGMDTWTVWSYTISNSSDGFWLFCCSSMLITWRYWFSKLLFASLDSPSPTTRDWRPLSRIRGVETRHWCSSRNVRSATRWASFRVRICDCKCPPFVVPVRRPPFIKSFPIV